VTAEDCGGLSVTADNNRGGQGPPNNVFDRVTEHTRDIEHYLQSEKNDDNSTTQLCDRRNVTFKESGERGE